MIATKKTSGRPTRLTPQVKAKILNAVQAGSYRSSAAALAGISERTMQLWCKRGKDGKGKLYIEFLEGLLLAEAASEIRMVVQIAEAAKEDPRAVMWLLERRFSERWGRHDRSTIAQTVKHEDAEEAGQYLSLEKLGEILAPFPEAKQAVATALQALWDAQRAKQIEDKGR